MTRPSNSASQQQFSAIYALSVSLLSGLFLLLSFGPDPASAQDTSTGPVLTSEINTESKANDTSETAPVLSPQLNSRSDLLRPEDTEPEEGKIIGKGDELFLVGNLVHIHGNALVKSRDMTLYADHVWADFDQNLLRASGNVRLISGQERTYSDELLFNLDNRKGIIRQGSTYSEPWYYRGNEIFKTEDDESYIRKGSLTTCSLKHPHYYFSSSEIIVKVDKELIAKNVVLKIGGIPLFYIPAYRRDLRTDKLAKVIVRLGTDSYQGPFLSIELPLSRKRRLDARLMFDHTSRRGRGGGVDSTYQINDTRYDEIFIPIFHDATPSEKKKLEDLATEIREKLDGDYDSYKLKELFLEYRLEPEDLARAKDKVEKIYNTLTTDLITTEADQPSDRLPLGSEAAFAQVAQEKSDHQETRYEGGDMGYIIRGEVDEEGERRLNPMLEDAVFSLSAGQISPILKTNFAYHIFRVDHILEVYGKREIKLRRIDIKISPTNETKDQIRQLADQIQEQALAGKDLADLALKTKGTIWRHVNDGDWLSLNEMDDRWQYSVRRLEEMGDVTTTVMTDRGVHIFQLVEKMPTPTFAELASDFETQYGDWLREEYERRKPKEKKQSQSFLMGTPTEQETSKRKLSKTDKKKELQNQVPSHASTINEDGVVAQKEQLEVFRQHDFQGSWQNEKAVARQARQLNRGEASNIINSKVGFHLIDIKKKRTYRGDFYLYGQDQYSYSRKDAMKIGREYVARWGHYHSIYTPWDKPEDGRKPLNFMGRTEWQARHYDENYGTSESAIHSFGMLTWGNAFSAWDTDDRDADGNLKFSTKTIGEFLGRLQFSHSYELIESDVASTLQKLPELSLHFSRMRMSNLPVFETINDTLIKISEKTKTNIPILSLIALPTLEDTSFDLDINLGNFFRKRYERERDVYLKTGVMGFDIQKQSTLKLSSTREVRLDLGFDSDAVWHDRDRDGHKNILRGIYSLNADARNILFRIYDISWIPGARRLRHQINSGVYFNYQPAVDRDENSRLYPFGPSTYFYERKDISYTLETSIEVKTRKHRSALRLIDFRTQLRGDFTEYAAENNRTYDYIESDITLTPLPNRKMSIVMRTTHDPNPSEVDGKRFKQVGFRSNFSYRREKWNLTFGNSFSKRTSYSSRRINTSFQYRPNSMFEVDFNADYDWVEKQFYSQSLTIRRNLHDWDLRLSWHRIGIKRPPNFNSVRQDFTFQINLIADSAASVGLGYDAVTETWGFRSLPVGVPYNAFGVGNAMSRSYF